MNWHSKPILSAKHFNCVCLLAIFGGSLLAATGCSTPSLRRAQCGSAMPAAYNWNNGNRFWNANNASQPVLFTNPNASSTDDTDDSDSQQGPEVDEDLNDGPTLDQDPSDETEDQSSRKESGFKSFVKAVSFTRPITADDELTKSIDAEIRGMETELGDQPDLQRMEDDLNQAREDLSGTSDAGTNDAETNDAGTDDSTSSDADTLPLEPEYGISGEVVDPSGEMVVMSTDNSAQLPHAAFYNDPYLLSLIGETISGNQELKILGEEIRIAANETYARSGEYRPFVSLGAGVGYDKVGRHTREGAVEESLEVADGRAFPEPLGDFLAAANLSWEVDIWNRLRNMQRAAAMRYLGTRDGRNYIVTRMVAEVAENYYELLALDSRLETLQATIKIQNQSLLVCKSRKAAGRATELSVKRFQAEVEKNLSEQSLIEQEIVEVENRINLLAGRFPQPVERTRVNFMELNLNTLGAGVPSELLRNRSDIREAERQVAAAGLDVKAAQARFYPQLSLTAGLGWNAFRSGYLFRTPESLIYGLAGELVGPLINKRAIRAEYCNANAAQLQAIYHYQQTVLEAHIEVVNQITKVENFRNSIEIKKQQLESLAAAVDAANNLFQNARAEYVEVLLAQREMMEARMLIIDIKQEQLSAVVNAYQALGGGGL